MTLLLTPGCRDCANQPGDSVATTLWSYATPIPIPISVNMLRLRWTSARHGRWKKLPAAPEHDRRREHELDPCVLVSR